MIIEKQNLITGTVQPVPNLPTIEREKSIHDVNEKHDKILQKRAELDETFVDTDLDVD